MRIENEYKKNGYFWLPDKKDRKITGLLTIKNGGQIELEIINTFDERIEQFNEEEDLNRIVGSVEGNELITLNNCFYKNKNISFGDIAKSTIYVGQALSGAAYEKDEVVKFNALSFSIDCLDEWINIGGIKAEYDHKNHTAEIFYSKPETISYNLNDKIDLEIFFAYSISGFSSSTEAKITQKAYFKLKSEVLRPLSDFTWLAHKITNLMCFAIDATVSLNQLSATSNEFKHDDGNAIPIKIFYESIPFNEKKPNKSRHEMLFTFNSVRERFQDVVNNWISSYQAISSSLNLYFSKRFGAQQYIEGQFLVLAQGLETYHRKTSSEKIMDDSQFKSLVDGLIDACPKDRIEWLEGRLKHGNEISLRNRIKQIIEPFKNHIGDSKSRRDLISSIVDTRNYLTHYSDELKEQSAQNVDLYNLCLKMEAIFQLHFLKIIGFTDAEISKVVTNSPSIKSKIKGVFD